MKIHGFGSGDQFTHCGLMLGSRGLARRDGDPSIDCAKCLTYEVIDRLRRPLAEAKLSGSRDGVEYKFRTNEAAATVAVSVVARWLRKEAQRLEVEFPGYETGYTVGHLERLADGLEGLAT